MPEGKIDVEKLEAQLQKADQTLENVEKALRGKAGVEALKGVSDMVQELKDSFGTIEMIEDVKITDYIKKHQEHTDQLEARIKEIENSKGFQDNKDEKQIEELVKNKDFIAAVARKDRNAEFILKSNVTTSSFTADSGAVAMDQLTIPGVEKHPWRMNPVFAALQKQIVGDKVHTITWYDENTRTDSAAAVAEGSSYAQSDVALIKRVISFYKAGHYASITEETLEDDSLMMGEINDLLLTGLGRERERQLLLGAGSASNEVLGIINATSQVAKDFAKPTGFEAVAHVNNFDVLRAAKLQVRQGYGGTDTAKMGFIANIALMNPADVANMDLIKDDNGVYLLPPFRDASGQRVSGMMIVESDDVTAGKFLVGDFTKAKVFIKRNIQLKTSEDVASNFLADIMVIKASQRMALKITAVGAYAFVYGDFETARALINS